MDLHQLKVFQAVAEYGSFTVASRKIYLSQSTVSQHIKQLETELECELFSRVGKRIYITEAGKVLYSYCEKISNDLRNAQTAIHELNGMKRGVLRFGSGATTLIYQLPPVLKSFKSKHPQIELVVMTDTTEVLIDAIKAQHLDLALVMLPVSDTDLVVTPICEEEIMIAVHKEHPLARKQSLSIQDAASLSFILYEKKTIMRRLIDKFFNEIQIEPKITMVMENIEAIKSLVGAGLGASILPQHAVEHNLANQKVILKRVHRKPLYRKLGLVTLNGIQLPKVAQELSGTIIKTLGGKPQ